LIPCLYFDEALSISKAVKSGDIAKASEILGEVLKNKPKENRWNDENNGKMHESSTRAFYVTGG
jgi:cyclic pyranopterin phosphate synthase